MSVEMNHFLRCTKTKMFLGDKYQNKDVDVILLNFDWLELVVLD